ncbi:hypothetical protein [Thiomicrorhabdus aquaedulcis]|nr:hypothetical protein [Thiomicrorhabdus aquaedulcis]
MITENKAYLPNKEKYKFFVARDTFAGMRRTEKWHGKFLVDLIGIKL